MIATFDPGRVAALRAELDRLVESGEEAGFSGLSYAELGNLLDDAKYAVKAGPVVEAAIDWQHDSGGCHFCGFEAPDMPHDEDCPLVEQGFIDCNGERIT